ncbi:MAG: DotU family type IV/VI secretion system protein, partial [Pyrinomonadaceae bacterium]|nr:DotU family type IV/VI secretion system protein [Pyrinomonadaceae bacterium]
DLVSLAAPVLDLILRIKAGIVAPSTELRPQVAALLAKFEERAGRFRHPDKITKLSKFALAAFVDETVLTNDFPLKDEWEKYPLQLEYFGEQLAGVKFFDRLEAMLKQMDAAVDAVEVYYVCMLLGFKGKYAVYLEHELGDIIRRTAEELRRAGRIQNIEVAPNAFIEDQPVPPKKPKFLPTWAIVFAVAGVSLSILIYAGLLVYSNYNMRTALDKLVS